MFVVATAIPLATLVAYDTAEVFALESPLLIAVPRVCPIDSVSLTDVPLDKLSEKESEKLVVCPVERLEPTLAPTLALVDTVADA